MRFHVVGIGPIGSLFSFHLRRNLPQQHDIHLIYRTRTKAQNGAGKPIVIEHEGASSSVSGFKTEFIGQYRSAVRNLLLSNTGKVMLSSPNHQTTSSTVSTNTGSTKGDMQEIESLIVACKAHSTSDVIRQLSDRLNRNSTVVLLQNGAIGVYEELISEVYRNPQERPHFILTSNNHGAWSKGSSRTVHAGIGTLQFSVVPEKGRDFEHETRDSPTSSLRLDDIYSPEDTPEAETYYSLRNTVAALQGLAELQSSWEPMHKLQISMRRKLVVNSVVNPLTALLGCRNGDLYGNKWAEMIASKICYEASQVFLAEAQAAGERLPPSLTAGSLMDEWQRVAKNTASNYSSMLSEIRRGERRTEVEYMNGYLARLAHRYRVHAPVNSSMTSLIHLRTSIPIDSI